MNAFWDPRGELRSAITNEIAMLSGGDIHWPTLIANVEWIGEKMEQEIDAVRRDQRMQFQRGRDRVRSGGSLGLGVGF